MSGIRVAFGEETRRISTVLYHQHTAPHVKKQDKRALESRIQAAKHPLHVLKDMDSNNISIDERFMLRRALLTHAGRSEQKRAVRSHVASARRRLLGEWRNAGSPSVWVLPKK
jgi:hypothetical protein